MDHNPQTPHGHRARCLAQLLLCLVLVAGLLPVGTVYAAARPDVSRGSGFDSAACAQGLTTDETSARADTISWRLLAAATPTPTKTQIEQLADQLQTAWNGQDWVQALSLIGQIKGLDPGYAGTACGAALITDCEYLAHVNYGFYRLSVEGNCAGAKEQFDLALAVKPGGLEAQQGIDQWTTQCATPMPPTPTETLTPTPTATSDPNVTPTVTLTVGPGTPTVTPQVISGTITYTVQAGDTLYSISKKFGTTVQAIMYANGLSSYYIYIGQQLLIPGQDAMPQPPGPLVHIVQPGETLFSIAAMYNTTVYAIKSTNGLSGSMIYAYQALFIPTLIQPGPLIHIVQPGQTLSSIAAQHNTTVNLIMLANNMTTYAIYVFQQLIIPPAGWNGWPPISIWTSPGPPVSSTYVVRHGDTLYSIARRHGTTVSALMAANGLHSSFIYSGMTLVIP